MSCSHSKAIVNHLRNILTCSVRVGFAEDTACAPIATQVTPIQVRSEEEQRGAKRSEEERTVVGGITEEQHAEHAVLLTEFDLETAEHLAVACDANSACTK